MIYILLPAHNRAQVTEHCVAALCDQDREDYVLWMVDDGCTDDTVDRVVKRVAPERLRILRGSGNLWWAGALQLCFEVMCATDTHDDDAVLIINDDMSFDSDFLSKGLAVLNEWPGGAVQAMGVDVATGLVDRGASANLYLLQFQPASAERPANCLSTRGLLMSATVFKQSGGFRPERLPHYLSDYEFTLRLRKLGVPLVCDPRFQAKVRLELTGEGQYSRRGLRRFWSEAFSNRAKYNPRHWTAFALMVCPTVVVPFQLMRIWGRFLFAMSLACLRAES